MGTGLSHSTDYRIYHVEYYFLHLAVAEESWHAHELYGGVAVGDPVLEWRRGWLVPGMVPAIDRSGNIPAKPGRSRDAWSRFGQYLRDLPRESVC